MIQTCDANYPSTGSSTTSIWLLIAYPVALLVLVTMQDAARLRYLSCTYIHELRRRDSSALNTPKVLVLVYTYQIQSAQSPLECSSDRNESARRSLIRPLPLQ